MKNTKTKLISSVAVLLICFAMLIGSTFAWFTDSASTSVNKIQAGNLDIEAYYQNSSLTNDGSTKLYTLPSGSPRGTEIYFENSTNPLDGAVLIDENVLFEPGYVGAKLVTVKNVGNLAANIKLQFAVNDNGLADQIWFDFIQAQGTNGFGTFTSRELTDIVDFANGIEMPLLANNKYQFIFMYGMKTTAGNEYQGKSVDLAVTVLAKQYIEENDSFNNQYDLNAEYDLTIWDGVSVTEVTENNDVYEINTAAELAWISKTVNDGTNTFSGKTVKLMKDINLANKSWTPIGTNADSTNKFQGTFDGQGNTISNLYVKQGVGYHAAGLFGALNGIVQNLIVDEAVIENLSAVGSTGATDNGTAVVAGSIYNAGLIDKVTVNDAKVNGNRYVGGIAGYVYGSVTNCIVKNTTLIAKPDNFTGSYDNGDKVGGIVGYFPKKDSNKIEKCSVENVRIVAFRDAGLIAGKADSSTVIDCSFDRMSSANPLEWNDIYSDIQSDYNKNIKNEAIGRTN